MKNPATVRSILHLGLLAGMVSWVGAAHGEGSRSLYPSTYPAAGFRANLDLQPAAGRYVNRVLRRGFFYVYAQAGEYIVLGSRNRSNGGDVSVYDPQSFGVPGDETIPATASFTCSGGSTATGPHYSGGTSGTIATRAQELAGPNSADNSVTVTNGFQPCAYRAPVTGIYGVLFAAATSGGAGPTGSIATPNIGSNGVSAWDVTVRANATATADLNGRLFTYAFLGFTGANSMPVFSTHYYVTADGYRYKEDLSGPLNLGLDPNGYAIYANSFGFLDNLQPLYKDLRGSEALVTSAPPGVTSQIAQYPLFFSDVTPGANDTQLHLVLTALGIPHSPPSPTVANVSFTGHVGGSTTTTGAGGTFTFTTTDTISFQIIVSRDGVDFSAATLQNAVVTGIAGTGTHTILWNGKDQSGTNFPSSGTAYPFRVYGRAGEVHFPIIDAEGNPGAGPVVTRLNGVGAPDTRVYFDDRGYRTSSGTLVGVLNGTLCGGIPPTPPSPAFNIDGVDSSSNAGGGYRDWLGNGNQNSDCAATAGWGDAKGLNLWTYYSAPAQVSTLVVDPIVIDVATTVTAPASAIAGSTVQGAFSFSNNGNSTATGVTYGMTLTPGLGTVTFGNLPSGVTATYNNVTGAVTFAGATPLPTSLIPGQTIAGMTFSYTAPASGPIVATTTIGTADPDQYLPNNTATVSTGIGPVDVLTAVSVPATATTGSTVSGSFQFANFGANAAAGVAYTATIGTAGNYPASVTFTSLPTGVTATYNPVNGQVTFSGMPTSLASGQSLGFAFSYPAPGPGTVPVNTTISTSSADANLTNNADAGSTTITAPDLTISKSDGGATFAVGASGTYTLTVTNAGTAPTTGNVTVSDTLPAGLTFVSGTGTDFTCSAVLQVVTCTRLAASPIAPSGSVAITLTVSVGPAAAPSVSNTATVSTPGEPNTGNNSGTDTTPVTPIADVTTTVTVPASANAGSTVSGTATFSNNGPSTAAGATYSLSLSPGLGSVTFPTLPPGVTASYDNATGVVTLTGMPASLTSGQSLNFGFSYTAPVTGPVAVNTTIGTSTPQGANAAPDTASGSTAITAIADVTTTVTVPASANAGSTVSGTATFSNNGPSTAAGATYSLSLSPGLGSVTFPTLPPGVTASYDNATGVVTLTGMPASLTSGQSLNFGFSYTAPVTGPVAVNTTIGTSTSQGANAAPDTASGSTSVTPSADLGILKTDGSGTYAPGQAISYTITVTNNGPSTVTSLTVTDAVPAAITSPVFSPSAGAYTAATGAWTGLNLAAGQSVTLTLSGTVSASATGNLVNTATVAPPAGTTDPTPGNDTSTDTDTVAPIADLYVTKSGPGSTTAGSNVTFNLLVGNSGPSDATGVTVTDPTPGGLVFVSASAPCAAGFPCTIGNLASGATVPLSVVYSVPAGYLAPDPIVNTASVAGNEPDPDPADNTSTSSTAVGRTPSADLAIVKSGPATASAGSTVTYSIVVTNNGPDDAAGVSLTDPTPSGLTFTSASAPCAAGFPCALGTLNAGASITVSVTFSVPGGYSSPDPIVNVASVSSTTSDPNPANNSSSASTALGTDPVDLSVLKSGPASVTAGNDITWNLVVRNAGPATATGVQLADPTPAGLSFVSASAPCAGGFPCALGSLAPGASIALTATFNVPVSYSGSNPVLNTATVTSAEPDANPADNTSTASTGVGVDSADLAVVKTGPALAVAGENVTYQVTVRNLGPGTAQGVFLADPTPVGLSFVSSSAPCAGGFPCSLGTIAAGSSVTVAATFAVPGGYTTPNPILNTATVTSTTLDGNPANDSSTVTTPLGSVADLSILKTDGSGTYTPGLTISYTITVTNAGPTTVTSLTVIDAVPASITGPVFTPSTGSYNPGTGTWTGLNLASGQSITLTLSGTVSAAATGNLVNTVTVAPPAGTTDPTPGDNTATDTDTNAPNADLTVTKTDGTTTYTPGGTAVYTIVVTNAGPSNVTGATVSDPLPTGITTAAWTCTASAGSTCAAAGTGAIADTVNILSGGTATYTLTLTIPAGQTGSLVNTVTVAVPAGTTDPTPGNNTATDTDTNAPSADLTVTKTDGTTTYAPGGTAVYTIVVTNAGPSNVTGATVSDPLPTGITTAAWTCTASAGSTCAATGTGAIADTVNLLASGTATYTLTLTIPAGQTGSLVNTVTVTAPAGTTDPTPGNNTATDTDTVSALADLVVTKVASSATVPVGTDFHYTITVRNLGPSNATNVLLTDPLPSGLLFIGASTTQGSCSGTATVTCALGVLAPNAQVEIVLTVRAGSPGAFVNTATATLNESDPTPPNNVATAPVDAQGQATIPTASEAGLLTLALLIAAAGMLLLRRAFPVG